MRNKEGFSEAAAFKVRLEEDWNSGQVTEADGRVGSVAGAGPCAVCEFLPQDQYFSC